MTLTFGAEHFGSRFGPPTRLEQQLLGAAETRLLLLACRYDPLGDIGPCVRAAVEAGIDWRAFLRLVRSHRLNPHVARSLGSLEELPNPVREAVRTMGRRAAQRSLAASAEAQRIRAALADAGIRSLTIKGPALAEWLYGDPAGRMFVDLDILVDRSRIGHGIEIVRGLGYGPQPGLHMLSPAEVEVAADAFAAHDATFWHPERLVRLELHWTPFGEAGYRVINRELSDELARPAPARRAGVLAAHVLMHGALHGYRRLGWLMDADGMARVLDDGAWAEIIRIAVEDRMPNSVLVGPFLAHRLLGASVPAPLERWLVEREGDMRRLAELAAFTTPNNAGIEQPGALRFQCLLRDRRLDRWRYVATKLARPANRDMTAPTLRPGWRGRLSRVRMQAPRLANFAWRRAIPVRASKRQTKAPPAG